MTPTQKKQFETLGNDLLSHPEVYAKTLLSNLQGDENKFGNFILSQQRKDNLAEAFPGKDIAKKLKSVQKEDFEYYSKNL